MRRPCRLRSVRSATTACALLVPLCFPGSAAAVLDVTYSPDVEATFDGQSISREDPAVDDLMGTVIPVPIGTVPQSADLIAYHREADGAHLLSFDTTVELGVGPLTARPGDVVRFDGSTYTLEFDADGAGVPAGVAVDAVARLDDDLMLSFDVTVALSGSTFADEDLMRFDGVDFSMFFDGSAAGVDPGLDVDAADFRPADGHILMSFDGAGSLTPVSFADEDVLEFDPLADAWSLLYDGSAQHAAWESADLVALAASPACFPGDCNHTASLDAGDPVCAVLCLIGAPPAGADCSCAADCNCSSMGLDAADPICTVLRLIDDFAPDSCE
jgi:hypothetical protein